MDSVIEEGRKKKDVFEGYPPEVKIRTKKMTIYLFIFAVVMLFGGLTSGYIVKMAGEIWVHIYSPMLLNVSLILLLLSSLTMWWSLKSMKDGNKNMSSLLLLATFLLGMGFSLTQYLGWQELSSKGMGFSVDYDENGLAKYRWNNYSEITGEYGSEYYFHVGGEKLAKVGDEYFMESDTVLANKMTEKLRNKTNNASAFIVILIVLHVLHLAFGLIYMVVNYVRIQKNIIHKEETIRLRVNGIYWHFMGILWIYLFVFLFIIH